ncbi:substrate-binding domain-containing protein [Belliella sp. R4-6]|uniref:Substrate-binding domain-containing protein n=1 Tax=Belliella alkalica TaxID=1730871 RepID=A0ABS9VCR0_9BACT|nr:substrate-binding domain-containing protein [Belliella alkalica]MCH7414232.1 substrate-binding domain-containing protein [Belliella alkalica]
MTKKKISIKDIAKELGISITTISFIINGKAKEKRISETMIKTVEDYVAKVGYRPNYLAQSLRSGKSKVIVFMVEDISNSFFSNIARLIEERAYKSGYKIIYCSTENDADKAIELIQTFKNRNVDGFIITPTLGLEGEIKTLLSENFAVILFDRWIPSVECSHVIVENEKSCYEGTEYLIQNGCKRIVFVTLESEQTQMQDRLSGYKSAMKKHGLESLVFEEPFHTSSPDFMGDQIIDFLKSHEKVDAVFFATNYLAFEGLHAFRKMEVLIPEDLQVLSFDDHFFFGLHQPSISAIAQPIEQIAESLMNGILHQLNGVESTEVMKIELSNKLVKRGSTFRTV